MEQHALIALAMAQKATAKELLWVAARCPEAEHHLSEEMLPNMPPSAMRLDALLAWADQQPVAQWLAAYERRHITVLTILDERYPPLLRHIYLPPAVLFCRGNTRLLHKPAVSLVGSRHHSHYGAKVCDLLISELASLGYATVSGLAAGIDTVVHQRSLAHQVDTIAVIGTGFGCCYPASNRALQEQLEAKQLVISEYPWQVAARHHHFPMRNRIIAGLSAGTVVIEAAHKSGSLITANVALQNNREVFAVPGSLFSAYSCGTNELIQAGAHLICSAMDIHRELAAIYQNQF